VPEWTKEYTASPIDVDQLANEILVSPAALQLVGNGSEPDGAIRFTDPDQLVIVVYAGEPTQAVKDALDAAVAAHDYLAAHKQHVIALVDTETKRRIGQGFIYDGKVLSLSVESQINWLGLHAARELMSYPVIARTKDDTSAITIDNAAEVVTVFATAVGTVDAYRVGGAAVKSAIVAATSVAAADAAAADWLAGL
jgi:hypothetical protein